MRARGLRPAPIRRLDPGTVEQIAAGEVVERPASVVKELVENSVDAGATEVEIRIERGGLGLIVVLDDGLGISPEEIPLAIERHATSKIREASDLAAVETLGFRGEALAAVGQVSRLRISSRIPGAPEASGVEVDGGRLGVPFSVGQPLGTRVEVRDLFYNTPARRKFLRSPAAEQLEVIATLERMYLARSSVALTLVAEGQELARYPAAERLEDAAAWVFGGEFARQCFGVELGGGARAVLSRPSFSRSTSTGLLLSVNGRPIVSRTLAQSVRLAYLDFLPKTRFPVGAVRLVLDPRSVDVNVHPTKREVRLADERAVGEGLRRAVRAALLGGPQPAEAGSRSPRAVPSASRGAGGEALPELETRAPRATASTPLDSADGPRSRNEPRQERLVPLPSSSRVAGTSRHPELHLVGPVFRLYWVAESGGDLVLVDQHAASERVLYEALISDGRMARQELVEPVRLPLTSRQRATLLAQDSPLRNAGYDIESFGAEQFRVLAVPVFQGRLAAPAQLPFLLDEIADGGRSTVPDGRRERLAASIACHAAVRGGDLVSAEELGRVLAALYRLPGASYACPHGRPIMIRLPRARLDRWFLRSGA
jgi:DNA mismatch repair protein MutL